MLKLQTQLFLSFAQHTYLKNHIKETACFKSLENPTCISLILTNRPKCFQKSNVFQTGLSDFHKLTFTALKAYFQKNKPKAIKYRNCENLITSCLEIIFWMNCYQNTFKENILIRLRLLLSIYLTDMHHLKKKMWNFSLVTSC